MVLEGISRKGFTLLEIVVAIAVVAILIGLSVPRFLGYIADRSLQNAAHLIQGDLRLAQQTAISKAGSGPWVEMCFHTAGYDIYPVDYLDQDQRDDAQVTAGAAFKVARAGQEYRSGITASLPAGLPSCLTQAEPGGKAVAFSGAGTPLDQFRKPVVSDVIITLTLPGRVYKVTTKPITGSVTVSR